MIPELGDPLSIAVRTVLCLRAECGDALTARNRRTRAGIFNFVMVQKRLLGLGLHHVRRRNSPPPYPQSAQG